MAGMRRLVLATVMCFFVVSDAQRLSQGASDWYMRFHDNFLVKRNVDRLVTQSFVVSSKIHYRYVVTTVTQVIYNPANVEQVYNFGMVMPKEALVSNVTIQRIRPGGGVPQAVSADLRPTNATIEDMDTQEAYENPKEESVQRGPAFFQFVLPVKLQPLDQVNVSLVYQYSLEKKDNRYVSSVSLSPGEVVEDFRVELSVSDYLPLEEIEIKGPSVLGTVLHHQGKLRHFDWKFNLTTVEQSTNFGQHGFTGDIVTQLVIKDPVGELDVVYDKEGFVHFYQGPQFEPLPTHATFLIDLSPSMSDDKLQLAKQALTILMQSLNRSDFFNIVLFNRPSESLPVHWSPLETSSQENQTISVEPETVEAAVNFISGLAASNASIVNNDLNEALNHSCKLGQGLPDNVARRLVLLTDGAHVASERCDIPFPLIILGMDANVTYLQDLAMKNDDLVENIEAPVVEDQLSAISQRLKNVILQDVELQYLGPDNVELPVTRNRFDHLHQGGSLVVAGQLDPSHTLKAIRVKGQSAQGPYHQRMVFIPGPEHLGCEAEIVLCSQTLFKGQCLTFDQSQTKLEDFAKKAASAKISGTCGWKVFTKSHFRGQSITLAPGEYETIPRFHKAISSLRVTPLKPEQEEESKPLLKRMRAYLKVQEALAQVEKDPLPLTTEELDEFLTPYNEAVFPQLSDETEVVEKEVVQFSDLNPVFFGAVDPLNDQQWKDLLECQEPVLCQSGFHYQKEALESPNECQLTLFTHTKFTGDALTLDGPARQVYHGTAKFRFRSVQVTGDCCWLLFRHPFYKGQGEKICGNEEIWRSETGSFKLTATQSPLVR